MLTAADPKQPGRLAGRAVGTLLTAVAGVAVLAGAAVLVAAAPVAAQSGSQCTITQAHCDGWSEGPGTPGGPGDDGGGDSGGGDGGGAGPCYRDGVELPCYDDIVGWFNREDECYYKAAEPQPPGGREGWTAYQISCVAGQVSLEPEWLENPPPGYEAPPDPAELRRRAYARIDFERPALHTAPDPDQAPGLVGLPVWVWSERTEAAWGPLDESERDRDVSVVVRAEVSGVTIDMGNGDSVECAPGDLFDAYQPGVDDPLDPSCGYLPGYRAPGQYAVTATVTWNVTWTINGEPQGTFATLDFESVPVTIEIDELQVVRE
ncbi:hypothetical protein [Solwaraspora sp. WMMA2101]|uniref:hypothetical protein n=1 Tax=Solwaraspora sp. WMMA2101 TaxID=3404124 RepID=UPI003B94B8BA